VDLEAGQVAGQEVEGLVARTGFRRTH